MLFVPALCSIATMWVSCLCWWIINRGYWSPWQNYCSAHNLIYGVQEKKKDFRSGRIYKCPSSSRVCYIWEAEATPRTQLTGWFGSQLQNTDWTGDIYKDALADNFEETPWRQRWRALYRRPVLCFPNMCTGGCAKCLGGTLIPLALFGFLANILLFFPGGKVIDNNDHLSEEVWFFGGILGSGVLVSREALKSPQRVLSNPFKIGYFWTRRYFIANKRPSIAWWKVSVLMISLLH